MKRHEKNGANGTLVASADCESRLSEPECAYRCLKLQELNLDIYMSEHHSEWPRDSTEARQKWSQEWHQSTPKPMPEDSLRERETLKLGGLVLVYLSQRNGHIVVQLTRADCGWSLTDNAPSVGLQFSHLTSSWSGSEPQCQRLILDWPA